MKSCFTRHSCSSHLSQLWFHFVQTWQEPVGFPLNRWRGVVIVSDVVQGDLFRSGDALDTTTTAAVVAAARITGSDVVMSTTAGNVRFQVKAEGGFLFLGGKVSDEFENEFRAVLSVQVFDTTRFQKGF